MTIEIAETETPGITRPPAALLLVDEVGETVAEPEIPPAAWTLVLHVSFTLGVWIVALPPNLQAFEP